MLMRRSQEQPVRIPAAAGGKRIATRMRRTVKCEKMSVSL